MNGNYIKQLVYSTISVLLASSCTTFPAGVKEKYMLIYQVCVPDAQYDDGSIISFEVIDRYFVSGGGPGQKLRRSWGKTKNNQPVFLQYASNPNTQIYFSVYLGNYDFQFVYETPINLSSKTNNWSEWESSSFTSDTWLFGARVVNNASVSKDYSKNNLSPKIKYKVYKFIDYLKLSSQKKETGVVSGLPSC